MNHRDICVLRILEEIQENATSTQRELAGKLNISLGLVNSFIKHLGRKGYLKITTIPKNRLRYVLTPTGFAEKTRLTYRFIQYSFDFYRTARKRAKAALRSLEDEGVRNVVFYGAGDFAEISYISLKETNLKMVAIVDDFRSGEKFLGHTIGHPSGLNLLDYDKIIVRSIDSKDAIYENLQKLNIPRTKIFMFE